MDDDIRDGKPSKRAAPPSEADVRYDMLEAEFASHMAAAGETMSVQLAAIRELRKEVVELRTTHERSERRKPFYLVAGLACSVVAGLSVALLRAYEPFWTTATKWTAGILGGVGRGGAALVQAEWLVGGVIMLVLAVAFMFVAVKIHRAFFGRAGDHLPRPPRRGTEDGAADGKSQGRKWPYQKGFKRLRPPTPADYLEATLRELEEAGLGHIILRCE